jgi:RNA polymerase sigma factor (sigma-70 family)
MSPTEDFTRIHQAQQGDPDALSDVLKSLDRLIRHVANKMGRVTTGYEDLLQAGTIGALIALESFDVERGVKLATYAKPFILEEVSKAVAESRQGFAVPSTSARRYWRCVKNADTFEEAMALAVAEGGTEEAFISAHHALTGVTSMDRHATDDDEGGSYEVASTDEDLGSLLTSVLAARSIVQAGLQCLEPRERTVLEMAFGLNGHPDGMTDGDIANELGVDRSRIVRIRNRSLTKVREFLTLNKEDQ